MNFKQYKHIIYLVLNILFFTFIFSKTITAQSLEKFFAYNENINDSSKLNFSFENTNFIKNNEYFSDFAEGYTLIGYFLKPKINYNPHKKLKISGGLHIQKYSGIEKFTKIQPTFSVIFAPSKRFSVIFGELNGTAEHDLPETILDYENYLTNNVENGLQLLFNFKKIKSDIWLDWQQYIFKNSEYPEMFVIGTSNIFNLINLSGKHIFNIKFAGTGTHIGGQIDNSGVPVETILNTISGFEYDLNINNKNNIKFYSLYHTALDGSPQKKLQYIYGYGILSGIEYNYKNIDLKIEHWFSEYYFTNVGSPLYQSISKKKTNLYEDQRALIIGHFFWQNNYFKFMQFGLGADFYYDLYNYSLDYSYGFYIKIAIVKEIFETKV